MVRSCCLQGDSRQIRNEINCPACISVVCTRCLVARYMQNEHRSWTQTQGSTKKNAQPQRALSSLFVGSKLKTVKKKPDISFTKTWAE